VQRNARQRLESRCNRQLAGRSRSVDEDTMHTVLPQSNPCPSAARRASVSRPLRRVLCRHWWGGLQDKSYSAGSVTPTVGITSPLPLGDTVAT
jgi:hypothetical protein